MSTVSATNVPPTDRREQPFLYTWNRRLRHLHGISLRNLNFAASATRGRGKTIADDEYNLKTTAKNLVQHEKRTLHHAKSYDQLAKSLEIPLESRPRAALLEQNAGRDGKRPARAPMRRRSTLHWGSSNPRSRQSKLEAVEINRLLTTWFSLHHEDLQEPVYISEVMENSMNPSFSFFDLDSSLSTIVRSDEFTLRVWAKTEAVDEYRMLVELKVNMRSLHFVGRSLEHFHHPLPENCVLLHLSDGIYTSFTDLPAEVVTQPSQTSAMKSMSPVQAAPFDALLKLANLDNVIQDALQTRAALEADINRLLMRQPNAEQSLSQLAHQRETLRNTKISRDQERKTLEHSLKQKDDLSASLQSRRNVLSTLPNTQEAMQERGKHNEQGIQQLRKQLQSIEQAASGQTRRICTSLLQIFPIEPVKNKTLQFTIRHIHLPNSVFSDTNRDEIAAALDNTAHVVRNLSLYLSVPLPYPIDLEEPLTFIRDDISAGIAQRTFPLQPSGPAYKFEYGVFLLNKDIEFLLNRHGLRVMDIRHTLPNLKYLMFVLTAGTGEMPDRKAGGIRGLFRDRLSPSLSRRNSDDSVASQTSYVHFDTEKATGMEETFHSALRAKALPYRQSLLRDAG